jgi:hypothetical protein
MPLLPPCASPATRSAIPSARGGLRGSALGEPEPRAGGWDQDCADTRRPISLAVALLSVSMSAAGDCQHHIGNLIESVVFTPFRGHCMTVPWHDTAGASEWL